MCLCIELYCCYFGGDAGAPDLFEYTFKFTHKERNRSLIRFRIINFRLKSDEFKKIKVELEWLFWTRTPHFRVYITIFLFLSQILDFYLFFFLTFLTVEARITHSMHDTIEKSGSINCVWIFDTEIYVCMCEWVYQEEMKSKEKKEWKKIQLLRTMCWLCVKLNSVLSFVYAAVHPINSELMLYRVRIFLRY